ncbi:MAG: phage tail assembly protein [Alphaproteobacteria bacterium]|nr:phage tail assembly protein [Alphaproteobacteria bacterium]
MSATVTLDFPVLFQGNRHATLTVRRCKVRDRIAATRGGGDDGEKEVRLFANLCEVDPAVIMEMDEVDYAKLQTAYLGFTRGDTASPEKP